MKRYQLLESWHNRCDNAKDELYCESDSKENLQETIITLRDFIKVAGLGPDFPKGTPKIGKRENDETVLYLGESLTSTEYWRSFRIVDTKPQWDFAFEEEFPDTAGKNFMGVLTDGHHFLFWHAYASEEGQPERCHIFDSLNMDEEVEICSYLWTANNDSILLEALNNLEDPADFCGEGSPIRTLKFKETE